LTADQANQLSFGPLANFLNTPSQRTVAAQKTTATQTMAPKDQ
jgi:hypothetical protein